MYNRKITQSCTERINNLNVSEAAKDVLRKMDRVASSSNPNIKKSVKDIFIVAPSCKELTKYAQCYEHIMMSNQVYRIRGAKTYLELAFPRYGTEREYQQFFSSPKIVAATQNQFIGVFLVSFEQWERANELLRDDSFTQLMKYVECNRENISFVFHVKPDFDNSQRLVQEIRRYVNVVETEITYPDLKTATDYMVNKLKESGMKLDVKAKVELKMLIDDKVDMESSYYAGYATLEMLLQNIRFELYESIRSERENRTKDGYQLVCAEYICDISERIESPTKEAERCGRLGFV